MQVQNDFNPKGSNFISPNLPFFHSSTHRLVTDQIKNKSTLLLRTILYHFCFINQKDICFSTHMFTCTHTQIPAGQYL